VVRKIAWGIAIVAAVAAAGRQGRCYFALRSAPPGEEVLRRAMRADLEAADYSGETETESFVRGGQVSARAHILHRAPGKYKVSYLSGPQAGMTVGSDGIMAWRCGSKGEVMEVTNETISPAEVAERFPLLLNNYAVRIVCPDTIAHRATWVIDVRPRYPGNAWKRLWVDKEHSVVLRSESYDSAGALRSRSAFRSIEYGVDISDLMFMLPSEASTYSDQQRESARTATLAALGGELGFKPRLPSHVPQGYDVEGYYIFDHRCCEGKSAIIRYVDGLNSISLFEAMPATPGEATPRRVPVEPANPTSGLGWVAEQFGASNVISVLDTSPQVVLVGDLSKAELLHMAESLK